MTAIYPNFEITASFALPATSLGLDLASEWYELDISNGIETIEVETAPCSPPLQTGRMFADSAQNFWMHRGPRGQSSARQSLFGGTQSEIGGTLGNHRKRPVAVSASQDDDDGGKVLPFPGGSRLERAVAALRRSLGESARAAVRELLAALQSTDSDVRREAAYRLGILGADAESALDKLTHMSLHDLINDAAKAAATAVAEISKAVQRTEITLACFKNAMIDTSLAIRVRAAYALGELKSADAAPALMAALADQEELVREAAASSIAELVPKSLEAISALGILLSDRSPKVRAAAAVSLGSFGKEAAPEAEKIGALLLDGDPHVRRLAAIALSELKEGAATAMRVMKRALAGRLDTKTCVFIVDAIENAGALGAEALPELVKRALRDKSEEVRTRCIRATAKMGDDPVRHAVSWLADAAFSDDKQTASNAIAALVDIKSAAPFAVTLFKASLNHPKPARRRRAAAALGRFGKDALSAIRELKRSLGDPDEEVRIEAAFAIASIRAGIRY